MRLASWQFRDAEEAWCWYVTARGMINAGARAEGPGRRPIATVDIDRALLHLYRRGVIGDAHLKVGVQYATEGRAPAADHPAEAHDARLWSELMERLRPYLVSMQALVPEHTSGDGAR